jgi:hypothetical protein
MKKIIKELFDCFSCENVRLMKINSSIARIDWKFHFKTKHDTELNKTTLINNKNLNHNHQIEARGKGETPVLHRTSRTPLVLHTCTPLVLRCTPLVLHPYSGVLESRLFPLEYLTYTLFQCNRELVR